MKHTIFITTFSKEGYEAYGKTWVDGFISNTQNVTAIVYTDFDFIAPSNRITVVDFNASIPQHKVWADDFYLSDTVSQNGYKQLGIKFSHKAFVILDILEKYSEGYIVWLDGDCEFKPFTDFNNFIPDLLDNKFIACQIEKGITDWRNEDHVESGILIFDASHQDKYEFVAELKILYGDHIKTLEKPYDGFLIKQALNNTNTQYIDLFTDGYTPSDSSANTTFIHPEIQCRFKHNIYRTIKKPFFEYQYV